jgi:transposase
MDALVAAAEAERPATPTYVREGQRTSDEQRSAVVALHKAGMSARKIAKHVGMSRNTVHAILARWRATGSPGSGSRSGRPTATDSATDAAIVQTATDSPFLTPRLIKRQLELTCSPDTIDRRLVAAGLPGRVARHKREHTASELRARLSFAEGYSRLDWKRVMCADEKYFYCHGHAGQTWVRRPVGEAFNPLYTTHKEAHPEYVVVWACISAHGQGDIVFLDGPLDGETYGKLMRDYLPLAADKAFTFGSGPWYFLHDNPNVHRGADATRALHDAGATVLEFPPYSPDLNVIENMWAYLGRKVDQHRCRDSEEVKRWIQEEWDNMPKAYFTKLFASYPARCQAVIDADGAHTKF